MQLHGGVKLLGPCSNNYCQFQFQTKQARLALGVLSFPICCTKAGAGSHKNRWIPILLAKLHFLRNSILPTSPFGWIHDRNIFYKWYNEVNIVNIVNIVH